MRGLEAKIAAVAVLSGLAIALSPYHIPIGPTKAYPWQHMVNVILGVTVGPIWASIAAFLIGVIRMQLGVGTVFSIPGGIPGALLVGIAAYLLRKAGKPVEHAAWAEPLGTAAIGFFLAVYLVAPLVGVKEEMLAAGLIPIWLVWFASSITGTVIGYAAVRALRKGGII
ncbi:MAG: energy coupling factor transporter S component ThiW [Desulfurococcales archaeon]|nr:energy coupling factor transporter S component ThiW [Desulfurococcales archaeon]